MSTVPVSRKEQLNFVKKHVLYFGILLIAFLFLMFTFKVILVSYNHEWKYSANYEKYADAFNAVKDYLVREFPNGPEKWLSVSISAGNGIAIFDPDTGEYLHIPSEVVWPLETIYNDGFPDKDSCFDAIRLYEERVSFCISNGQYALVYSPNEKPTWVNSPSENVAVRVKAIQDGWYHVTKDE